MAVKMRALNAVALGALMQAPVALAQEAQTQGAEDQEFFVERILVTTQKREQDVRDVPITISVFTQDQLDLLGIEEFDKLAQFTPGLFIQEQSPNNPGFVVRGITSDSGEATNEPRVAVFQDGVTISRSRGSIVELFDLERVEIAKGPQPTLFGRSALVGGIDVITAKPSYEDGYSGRLTAGAGNFGSFFVDGAVNIPLIDNKLAARLAFRIKEEDAFIPNITPGENDLNSSNTDAVRLSIRFNPTERLQLDGQVFYQFDNPDGVSFKSGTFAPTGGDLSPNTFAELSSFGDLGPLRIERETYGFILKGAYEITEALSFTSISSFREFESLEVFDPDGFGAEILAFAEEAESEQFFQEIRLNYDDGGILSGFIGFAYFHEEGSQTVPLRTGAQEVQGLLLGAFGPGPIPAPVSSLPTDNVLVGAALAPILGFTPSIPLPAENVIFEETIDAASNDSYDIFGEVVLRPFEGLELIGGARWTQDIKISGFESNVFTPTTLTGVVGQPFDTTLITVAPGVVVPVPVGGFLVNPSFGGAVGEADFNGFGWRFAARYALTPDWNVYASYARSRRPEVIDPSAPAPGVVDFEILPAEIVNSFEGGVKGFVDLDQFGELNLEVAAFYFDYQDFQSSIFGPDGLPDIINAGAADAVGVEFQANWTANEFAELFINYGFNRARFDDEFEGEPAVFAGNQFRLSPDQKFAVGGIFTYPTRNWGTFQINPSYTFQTEIFFDDDNDLPELQAGVFPDLVQDEVQPSFGLLDIRARWNVPGDRFTLEMFVENLTNEDFIIDAGNTGDLFGIPTFIGGPPRFWGGRVTGRF